MIGVSRSAFPEQGQSRRENRGRSIEEMEADEAERRRENVGARRDG